MEKIGEYEVKTNWDFAPVHRGIPFEIVHKFPEGETVVGLIEFQDRMVVATSKTVYQLRNGVLQTIPIMKEIAI